MWEGAWLTGGSWQTLSSYDVDSTKTVDYLLSLPTCSGRLGATGMCLGGHLALRASVSSPKPRRAAPSSTALLRLLALNATAWLTRNAAASWTAG